MLTQDSLEAAVRAGTIHVPPVFLDDTGSTNAEARALAERGAPEWMVVATNHQTAGRGRLGRSWVSAPGKSLLFSVLLRPSLSPQETPLVSLAAASIMTLVCREFAEVPMVCKWPNDLVVGERKVGGLLSEAKVSGSALEYLVIGVGVNLTMNEADFPEDLRPTATSLAMAGGTPCHPADLLREFLLRFRAVCRPEVPDAVASWVMEVYRPRCVTIGRRVRATTVDGTEVEGVASGLTSHGGLVVGGRTVAFGEVIHLDQP